MQVHEQHKSTFDIEDDNLADAVGRTEDEDEEPVESEDNIKDDSQDEEDNPDDDMSDVVEVDEYASEDDDEEDRPKLDERFGFVYAVGGLKDDLPKLKAQIQLWEDEMEAMEQKIDDLEDEKETWTLQDGDYRDKWDVYIETMGQLEQDREDLEEAGRDLKRWKRQLVRKSRESGSQA